MERRTMLAVLVLSIRSNLREVNQVLEELNRGRREKTYLATLTRCLRTIEHDARVVGLDKLADFVAHAKAASAAVLHPAMGPGLLDLLSETSGELARVAEVVERGERHRLNADLAQRLEAAARRTDPRRAS